MTRHLGTSAPGAQAVAGRALHVRAAGDVAEARLETYGAPLVIGCGPVGLAVIAALKLRGVEPLVASDFSPTRRALAERMGAHVVVDPAVRPTFEAYN